MTRRQRILRRAFILLLALWLIDLVSLFTVLSSLDNLLGGYLAVSVMNRFLILLILGLLIQEVTKS